MCNYYHKVVNIFLLYFRTLIAIFSLHCMMKSITTWNQKNCGTSSGQPKLSNHCANAMDFERTTKHRKAIIAKEVSSREKPGPPHSTIILHIAALHFLLAAASAKLPCHKRLVTSTTSLSHKKRTTATATAPWLPSTLYWCWCTL